MNVGDILKKAYDGVSAKLEGVIKPVTITRTTVGSFNPTTGVRTPASTTTQTGRAVVENEQAIRNVFPAYVVTGTERLVLLEGLQWAPQEGDTVAVEGLTTRKIGAVLDLLAAGKGYRAVLI